MDLLSHWSEEAYEAMLRALRAHFGEQDLIYETAADRYIEMRERDGPAPNSAGDLIGLCLCHLKHRALDNLRKQRRLNQRCAPLAELADPRSYPGQTEIRAMLLRVQERCLRRLPAKHSNLLDLYFLQGLSDREIAWRRVREAGLGSAGRGASDAEKARAADVRRRAIAAARRAVNRERHAAIECLRGLIEAEAHEELPAA